MATIDMQVVIEITGAIAGVITVLGFGSSWVRARLAEEAEARKGQDKALLDKIDDETKDIEGKIDHKHNNVLTQFQATNRKLDQQCEKLELATKDIIRLSETQKMHELQVREVKTEMKEGFHELRKGLDDRFDKMAATQQHNFNTLATSIREIRKP